MDITKCILTRENEHGIPMFGSKQLVSSHIFQCHEGVCHGNLLVTALHGVSNPPLTVSMSSGDLSPHPLILTITLEVLVCTEA